MTSTGRAVRLSTQINIPVEIGVPDFIQEDHMAESGALHGTFKLSLQSVVCHRGNSVDSGHYIALVRGTVPPSTGDGNSSNSSNSWMRFDDLAPHRITMVDIEKALKEETPYLLFYQIVPIEGDPGRITSGEETLRSASDRNPSVSELSTASEMTENKPPSGRPSFELPYRDDRGRSPAETRRTSVISFSDQPPEYASDTSLSVPGADTTNSHQRNGSLSRTQSKVSDGLGRTLSKLRGKKSGEKLPPPAVEDLPKAAVHVTETSDRTLADPSKANPQPHNNLRESSKRPDHKREKSKSRLSRSKARGEKPDRECSVM